MLDATAKVRRQLAKVLNQDEQVQAGVSVLRVGTTTSAILAASAAVAGCEASMAYTLTREDAEARREDGLPPRTSPYYYLVVTTKRVLVVGRSIFGRTKDVVMEMPLSAVADLTVNRSTGRIQLTCVNGHKVLFETPRSPEFLPDVYWRLGELAGAGRQPAAV